MLMHLAAVADRRRWRRIADWLRGRIPSARVENAVGKLLRTSFAIVRTECGGCAIDIDRDEEYEAARARFDGMARGAARRAPRRCTGRRCRRGGVAVSGGGGSGRGRRGGAARRGPVPARRARA